MPNSEQQNANPPPTRPGLRAEMKRIARDSRPKRKDRHWLRRLFGRGCVVGLLFGCAFGGYVSHQGGGVIERIKTDPIFLNVGLAYLGYEVLMKAVEAVQDDKREFDAAAKWLAYPIRVGVPIAAVGFLMGDDAAGFLGSGEPPRQAASVITVCLYLLIGGLWRAAYVAQRPKPPVAVPSTTDTR